MALVDIAARELETGEFENLTSALVEVRGDSQAAGGILGSDQARAAGWLQRAHQRLRAAFVDGRLEEAEALGEAIGSVLRFLEDGSNDELAENRVHSESLRWLIAGINEINNRDLGRGIQQLTQLTESVYCSESLQWVAWLWIAKSAAEQGDLSRSLEAVGEALSLANGLDESARSVSLSTAAETHFLAGDHAEALQRLEAATESVQQLGDERGLSQIWLARARIEADKGDDERAAESAGRARAVDPENHEAVVFLAGQALVAGDVAGARALLTPAVDMDTPSAEAVREMRLATMVEKGEVSAETLKEYHRLRGRPPSQETVERLRQMVEAHADFLQLRELLAWSLTRMGFDDEAATHFELLVEQAAAAELQRSALLGLGCLANRRHTHRQPGRWIRSASTAVDADDVGAEEKASSGLGEFDADELEEAMDLLIEGESPGRQTVPAELWQELDVGDLMMAENEPSEEEESSGLSLVAGVVPEGEEQRKPTVERAAVPAPRVAFTGQLQLLSVPDLLDFLKSSRRTGTLVLTSDDGIGAVHLRDGWITSAASPNGTNIGKLLLEQGLVDEEQLRDAASAQAEQPDRLLGAMLASKGIVDETAIKTALHRQVLSAITELARWGTGDFAFEPDNREQDLVDSEIDVTFDTQGMLLDALRVIDEEAKAGG